MGASTVKLASPPAALIAAVLVAVFGPRVGGVDVSQIATYVAAVLAGLTAAIHGPRAAKAVASKTKLLGPPSVADNDNPVYNQGFQAGFQKAFQEAFQAGWRRAVALKPGFNPGFQAGFAKAFQEAFQEGFRAAEPKPAPAPRHTQRFAMFDSITVSTVRGAASTSGEAVAGYVDGNWPDFQALVAAFPNDDHLSIAVTARDNADCLDIEKWNASPDEAAAWVRRQHARGLKRPCLYADRSTMPAVWGALSANGIGRGQVRLWVAEWTYQPHIPTGYDACQWTDRALGRNLDESLCEPNFFD